MFLLKVFNVFQFKKDAFIYILYSWGHSI